MMIMWTTILRKFDVCILWINYKQLTQKHYTILTPYISETLTIFNPEFLKLDLLSLHLDTPINLKGVRVVNQEQNGK